MSTESQGIRAGLNIDRAESGIIQPSKLTLQKRWVRIFGVQKRSRVLMLENLLAEENLRNSPTIVLNPKHFNIYSAISYTKKMQVVTICSFSMHPWIPNLIPLYKQHCPCKFLFLFCCSQGTVQFESWFLFFWHKNHMHKPPHVHNSFPLTLQFKPVDPGTCHRNPGDAFPEDA